MNKFVYRKTRKIEGKTPVNKITKIQIHTVKILGTNCCLRENQYKCVMEGSWTWMWNLCRTRTFREQGRCTLYQSPLWLGRERTRGKGGKKRKEKRGKGRKERGREGKRGLGGKNRKEKRGKGRKERERQEGEEREREEKGRKEWQ